MDVRLLRGVSGKVLGCGCLVGVYETYEGTIVRTIDARGAACGVSAHRPRAVIVDGHDVVSELATSDSTASPRS